MAPAFCLQLSFLVFPINIGVLNVLKRTWTVNMGKGMDTIQVHFSGRFVCVEGGSSPVA